MTKRKYPSELNTKPIRVNIGDWQLLTELARQLDITIAKALHRLLTRGIEHEPETATPRTQIPMPIFTAKPIPVLHVTPQPVIAVNGHKAGVFVIKPKGGVINA
ncbi:hypothetical protein ES705_48443 [subsurface metagenome]